jgi:hypothetical protein
MRIKLKLVFVACFSLIDNEHIRTYFTCFVRFCTENIFVFARLFVVFHNLKITFAQCNEILCVVYNLFDKSDKFVLHSNLFVMKNINKEKILFLDIETVPQTIDYRSLPGRLSKLWEEKAVSLKKRLPERYTDEMDAQTVFANGAGIFSEFGKIVCISAGFIYRKNGEEKFRVKSFYGDDEAVLLRGFCSMLLLFGKPNEISLCGHNIKEFDVPYICRRLLVNGLPLPDVLDIGAKKPWEVPFMDTLEMWRFGDYKNYTSLNLLTAIFNIPTPKDDIDGSEVAKVYYEEKNVERISVYCQKDVVATAQLWLRLNSFPLIEESCIEHV